MIFATIFDPVQGVAYKPVVAGELGVFRDSLKDGQKLWLDVAYQSGVEIDDLINVLGIHSDFIKNEGYNNETIELNGKYVFFTLKLIGDINKTNDGYDIINVKCFAFDDVVVTVCSQLIDHRDGLIEDLSRIRAIYDDFAYTFFTVVLTEISNKYLGLIEGIRASLEKIENRVENKSVSGVMASIKVNKRKWSFIEYVVEDHRNHYGILKFDDGDIPVKKMDKVFSQVYSNMDFLAKQIDKLKELSKDIKDDYGAIMQGRSNSILFVLAVIAGMFTIPNYIAALYNMQVKDIPLTDVPHGFTMLFVLMLVIFAITGTIGYRLYKKVSDE